MTDKDRPDRRVHISPANGHQEDNGNVYKLPTEAFKVDATKTFARIEPPMLPSEGRVREVVRKCLNRSKQKAEVEETPHPINKRQTVSADIARQRRIREKCLTIREITITILTIFGAVNMVIFVIWLQILLYAWSHN